MLVRILEQAEQDLKTGFLFYESQQAGLGDYFLHSLFSEIDSLALFAGMHRVVFESHRLLARKFPYAVYYDIVDGEAWVWAVVDCRRNPDWTKQHVVEIKHRHPRNRRTETRKP